MQIRKNRTGSGQFFFYIMSIYFIYGVCYNSKKLWSSIMPIKFKMLKMDGCVSGGYVGA